MIACIPRFICFLSCRNRVTDNPDFLVNKLRVNVRRSGFLMLISLLLAGCMSAAVSEQMPPQAQAGGDVVTPESGEERPASRPETAPTSSSAASEEALQRNLETLANRLTLMQEQLIALKAQGAELTQQSETVLARLQMLTEPAGQDSSADTDSTQPMVPTESPAQLASLIDQLSVIANELSLSGVGDIYRMVAVYTATGGWVLVRYDRFSGQAWLANQVEWQPLLDPVPLSRSEYEIQLTRADSDIRGYVAARLDRRSGDTWWLKQDTWQKFD